MISLSVKWFWQQPAKQALNFFIYTGLTETFDISTTFQTPWSRAAAEQAASATNLIFVKKIIIDFLSSYIEIMSYITNREFVIVTKKILGRQTYRFQKKMFKLNIFHFPLKKSRKIAMTNCYHEIKFSGLSEFLSKMPAPNWAPTLVFTYWHLRM